MFFEWETIAGIDFDRYGKTGQSSHNRTAGCQLPRRRSRFQPYSNREWRILAYVQTLCAGQKYGENWELLEWYQEWADSVNTARVASLLKAEQWDVRFGGLAYTMLPKRYQAVKQFTSLLEYAYHRRFAKTAKGYFCLVPRSAKEGDLICLLQESDYPAVIREFAENWKFVGEAYVHGLRSDDDSSATARRRVKRLWFD